MDHDRPEPTGTDGNEPLSLRQLAAHLGISYDAARIRVVEHKWPHIKRGPRGKGGYRFLPRHVAAVEQIETVTAGQVGRASLSGRTPRSRARSA